MPLHPQAQALLDQLAATDMPSFEQMTVEQVREAIRGIRELAGSPEAIAHIENRTIPSPAGALPVRLYIPHGQAPFPILVYFHGGGWIAGDLDTMDVPLRALANHAGCLIISVDYRLAPEHKFPAALDDAYAATSWAIANATTLSGDSTRVAVGGDSAGGNLAAAVALMARDRQEFSLAFQLLICPVMNHDFNTNSYQKYDSGYLLTRDTMKRFWQDYLKDAADGQHPYASPLQAKDLSHLPPALVITAEYDPLRDEAVAYATRLQQARVTVFTKEYEGMIHGFYQMAGAIEVGEIAIKDVAQVLKAELQARDRSYSRMF